MAIINKKVTTQAQTQFHVGTDGNLVMAMGSDGNVGIGTSSPAAKLDLDNGSSDCAIRFGSDTGDWEIKNVRSTHALTITDSDGTGEVFRIDTSGNLLHGCTGTSGSDISDGGILLRSDSTNFMQISSGSTGDSNLIIFYKKSGTGIAGVGSIGSEGSELTVGQTTAGLQFLGSEAKIRPFNMSTNSASNGVVDLGRSNAKFKDLYLSGAIKMDSDLDDYEEGTWNPNVSVNGHSTGAINSTTGRYVKIGSMVHAYWRINYGSTGYMSSYSLINNLPFTVPVGGYDGTAGNYGTGNISAGNWGAPTWVEAGTANCYIYPAQSSSNTSSYSGFCVYFIS